MYEDEDLMIKYDWDTTLVGAYLLGKDAGKIASKKTRTFIQDLDTEKIGSLHPKQLVEDMCDNKELGFERKFERNSSLFEAFMAGFNSSET